MTQGVHVVLLNVAWFCDDQLIGKESYVTLIDETTHKSILWQLLMLTVHFSLEKLRLCAWKIHCMIL